MLKYLGIFLRLVIGINGVPTQDVDFIPIEEPTDKLQIHPQEHIFIEFADNPDQHLNTPELAAKYGYPVEVHKVTTADGYILTLHRIRNGKNAPPAPPNGRPVAYLQHGLLCSSADWILNTQDKALAYRLADEGYDVWMGNARGNTYSREHVTLSSKKKEFWNFSYHEMGKYDLPANFDYVLRVTGYKNMYYIGHSMGTTMFFICMSLRPEYNAKIRLMSALAPIAFTEYMVGSIRMIAPFSTEISWILSKLGAHEFLPSTELMDFLGRTLCNQKSPIQSICSNALFLMMGYNVEQLNVTLLPVIMGHDPAGTSVRTPVHYAQGINTGGRFCQFDFGREENIIRYGSEQPPDYDLSKITAPIALYWGSKDWLGVENDVLKFSERIPNLVRRYRVPFNHLDFLFAIDTPTLLYQTLERFMKRY